MIYDLCYYHSNLKQYSLLSSSNMQIASKLWPFKAITKMLLTIKEMQENILPIIMQPMCYTACYCHQPWQTGNVTRVEPELSSTADLADKRLQRLNQESICRKYTMSLWTMTSASTTIAWSATGTNIKTMAGLSHCQRITSTICH